jgi:hypothetical protein
MSTWTIMVYVLLALLTFTDVAGGQEGPPEPVSSADSDGTPADNVFYPPGDDSSCACVYEAPEAP